MLWLAHRHRSESRVPEPVLAFGVRDRGAHICELSISIGVQKRMGLSVMKSPLVTVKQKLNS